MACSVCDGPAEEVRNFDRITVHCRACEPYDLSGTVYDTEALKKFSVEERRSILHRAKARAQPGARPYIDSNDVPDLSPPTRAL
jgi:hypothetical protein